MRARRYRRSQGGFTIIELMVVLAVIAILIAIAIPSFLVHRNQARDTEVKLQLTSSAKVQASLQPENGGYINDPVVMGGVLPEIDFTGAVPESVHLVVGDVSPGDQAQVLLYARSLSGTWFGIRLVLHGAEVGRHTCKGAEADMTLLACLGSAW